MKDFRYKSFEQMTPDDYAEVGFKAGLEVHQQLLTERKLFCRCPAGQLHNEGYHSEILRHMRPTLSELGEYDGTALMEFKTKKNILYRIRYDNVCTYEMDDTPPFMIDEKALDIAFEIGLLYNASIVDELHIARKQYLDGSIPTGFQRTAITCVGGQIPYKDRQIKLIQMSIEEDSCRETSDIGHNRIYLTDRLGTPLIETVTHPEMKTPQEIADVNEIIRKLARSTGKVRTGMGAGRQDVNVSVEGGTRIEIKGVSHIKNIPRLAYNESMRQWNLLRLRENLISNGITTETFKAEYKDVSSALKRTSYAPIFSAIERGWIVNCVILKGYKGAFNWETQTDTVFAKEVSDRVRVIACLTTLPNILHSDNARENLMPSEWSKLKKIMQANENDTIVLVWGTPEDAITGAKEIIIRAKEATVGIPSETRQALIDGTNGFERILPGPERMYPDTDLPPQAITLERLNAIKSQMPQPFWNYEAELNELGVRKDLISQIAMSKFVNLFFEAVNEYKISPKVAVQVLNEYPKKLKRQNCDTDYLDSYLFNTLFSYYSENKICREGLYYSLRAACVNEGFTQMLLPDIATDEEILSTIKQYKEELKSTYIRKPEKYDKILMGLVMTELRGRVDGIKVLEFINKEK